MHRVMLAGYNNKLKAVRGCYDCATRTRESHHWLLAQGDLGRDAGRRLLRELEADGGWDAVYALHSGALEPSSLVRARRTLYKSGPCDLRQR